MALAPPSHEHFPAASLCCGGGLPPWDSWGSEKELLQNKSSLKLSFCLQEVRACLCMCLTVKLPKNRSNNPNMPTTSKNTERVHRSVPDTIVSTPLGLPPFTLAFLPLTVKETAAQVKITASNGGYIRI